MATQPITIHISEAAARAYQKASPEETGPAHAAFIKANNKDIFLLSDATFSELRDVLHRAEFDSYISNTDRRRFLIAFLRKSHRVVIHESVSVCSDPDDNMFLEVAINGKADCIITRNVRDFPPDRYRGIPIQTPEDFLRMKV